MFTNYPTNTREVCYLLVSYISLLCYFFTTVSSSMVERKMRKILQYMQLILPYSCHFEFLNLEREMSRTRVEQPMKEMKEYYCCILLAITSLFWYLELFSPQITNGVIFLHLHYFSSTERGTDCIPTKRHWLVVSTVGCSPGTVKV